MSTISPSPLIPFRSLVRSSYFRLSSLIQLSAGQRYSFVLTANKPVSNYWIRAQPTLAGTNQGFVNATNSAILRYVGAPARDPTTNSSIKQPLVETALHPLVPTPVPGVHRPGAADVNLRLEIGLDFTTFKWQLNGSVGPMLGDGKFSSFSDDLCRPSRPQRCPCCCRFSQVHNWHRIYFPPEACTPCPETRLLKSAFRVVPLVLL